MKYAKIIDGKVTNISVEKPKDVANWSEVGDDVFAGFIQESKGVFKAPPKEIPPATSEDVNAERDRRVSSGIPFNGKLFDFDQNGKDNITGAATLAKFSILKGSKAGDYRWANPEVDFSWITQDNTMMLLDAPSMSTLGDIAAGWTTSHFVAARLIKDMSPIPEDYTDDKYWP